MLHAPFFLHPYILFYPLLLYPRCFGCRWMRNIAFVLVHRVTFSELCRLYAKIPTTASSFVCAEFKLECRVYKYWGVAFCPKKLNPKFFLMLPVVCLRNTLQFAQVCFYSCCAHFYRNGLRKFFAHKKIPVIFSNYRYCTLLLGAKPKFFGDE